MYIRGDEESNIEIDYEYEYKSNIGNTLELDIEEKWGIEGFDLVAGNPPYNPPTSVGSGATIWQEFVKKSLNNWIKLECYLLFIHPSSWRKPTDNKSKTNGLFKLMTQKNKMIYLEIHNTKDGMKTFNCGTRYDWYLIQKNNQKIIKTMIKGEDGIIEYINLDKYKFINY